MKKIFILIAFILAITITPKVHASEKISEHSATLTTTVEPQVTNLEKDARVIVLEKIFKKYNSDLSGQAKYFVYYADKNGIDWQLLPAISGLESYFGTMYAPGTYNAYGWGGGYIYFESWEDGINQISVALRKNYYDSGLDTVYKIGPVYAEDPNWAVRVNNFKSEINQEYIRMTTLSVAPSF
jgi:uncharacterized protein YycO